MSKVSQIVARIDAQNNTVKQESKRRTVDITVETDRDGNTVISDNTLRGTEERRRQYLDELNTSLRTGDDQSTGSSEGFTGTQLNEIAPNSFITGKRRSIGRFDPTVDGLDDWSPGRRR